MLANGPFWSSRVRTCSHGTAPAGGGTLMFMGCFLFAPSPRRGEGRGEGRSELQMEFRAPLTRLASLATLSPQGRGEDLQSLQPLIVTGPPAAASASAASFSSMTSSTDG